MSALSTFVKEKMRGPTKPSPRSTFASAPSEANAIPEEVILADFLERDSMRGYQKRWFVLRGNAVFYWKQSDGAEIGNQSGDFLLSRSAVVSDMKKKGKYFCFEITVNSKTYRLRSDSEETVSKWVNALREIVDRRLASGPSHADEMDDRISLPFGATHEQHVDFDLQWTGTKDPEEVFSKGIKLGEGGFGSVWEATHKDSGFVVALKIVSLEHGIEGLQKEIEVLKACHHPNVVEYFGTLANENELWILMENCEIGSVRDIMQMNLCTLEEEQISVVCLNILKGLCYLHQNSIIHFDIKAANILVSKDMKIKLADFGVSEQLEKETGKADDYIGSPFWMSPEVIRKETYSNNTDVWSLGITVIEMADGRPPLAGQNPMEVIKSIPERPPPTVRQPDRWSEDFNDFVAECFPETDHQLLTNRGFLYLWEVERILAESSSSSLSSSLASVSSDKGAWGDLLVAGYDPVARQILFERPNALVCNPCCERKYVEFTSPCCADKWALGSGLRAPSQSGHLDIAASSGACDDSGGDDDGGDGDGDEVDDLSLLTTFGHRMYVQPGVVTQPDPATLWGAKDAAASERQWWWNGSREFVEPQLPSAGAPADDHCAFVTAAELLNMKKTLKSSSAAASCDLAMKFVVGAPAGFVHDHDEPVDETTALMSADSQSLSPLVGQLPEFLVSRQTDLAAFCFVYGVWVACGSASVAPCRLGDRYCNQSCYCCRCGCCSSSGIIEFRVPAAGSHNDEESGDAVFQQSSKRESRVLPDELTELQRALARLGVHELVGGGGGPSCSGDSDPSAGGDGGGGVWAWHWEPVSPDGVSSQSKTAATDGGQFVVRMWHGELLSALLGGSLPPAVDADSTQVGGSVVWQSEQQSECRCEECDHARKACPVRFSSWVWLLSSANLRLVVEGLVAGTRACSALNGNLLKSTARVVTWSAGLRDDLVRASLLTGWSPRFEPNYSGELRRVVPLVRTSGGQRNAVAEQCWTVVMTPVSSDAIGDRRPGLLRASSGVSETVRKCRSWCVSMPSGFVVARRALADPTGCITKTSRPVVVGNCLVKDSDERTSSVMLCLHAFIQTTKGPEVLKPLVIESLHNKMLARMNKSE